MQVWNSQGDIRDVIAAGKLIRQNDGAGEIEQVMNTIALLAGRTRTVTLTLNAFS